DPVVVTLLIAAFALAQLLASPFWGRFSDRLGRRPMIILDLVVTAVSLIRVNWALAIASGDDAAPGTATLGLWLLFVSRSIQGAGAGTTGVVQAYVSDVVPAAERGKALGWVSAATSAGVTLGGYIGSLAARWGEAAPGLIAAGL